MLIIVIINFIGLNLIFLKNKFIVIDFFDLVCDTYNKWFPWINVLDDVFIIQFAIVLTILYMYTNNNIYYVLLYVFFNFFLIGLYLAIYQVEFFTAFLFLIECSVLFVFLLLLFYLNIKGVYTTNYNITYKNLFIIFIIYIYTLVSFYMGENDNLNQCAMYFVIIDNYYEIIFNPIMNDIFVFLLSYYFFNALEFLLIGFLLLLGSVICVNLYQTTKGSQRKNYLSIFSIFNFFNDFVGFSFLRKQNLIKQGNTKASLKIFIKK